MRKIIIGLVGVLFASMVDASDLNAYVTQVYDGDTITFYMLEDKDKTFKGRMYGIDAPEMRQEHGIWSRNYLRNRIANNKVHIKTENTDRYGRLIVTVFDNDDQNVNVEMAKQGMAWSYRSYNDNNPLYNDAEQFARDARLGLWKYSNPVEPWGWRKLKRYGIDIPTNPECDYTLKCSTIESCEKAKFLLNECGFSYLDGNNSGTPCQNLCN